MKWSLIPMAVGLLVSAATAVFAQQSDAGISIRPYDWHTYKQRFLDPSGRIIDDANGNISHSEGQGYGLLLALKAGSRSDFDLIWAFTKNELLLRNDGLAAWKWDPNATPHISDANNATDGDLLIAYALALASERWGVPDYAETATAMAEAVARTAVQENQGRLILLPATSGFGVKDRQDGPVINPSYWIFETFPVLAKLAPSLDWARLGEDGQALIRQASNGPRKLPADWISLRTMPKPAQGFEPIFGYNALRIPLYMVRGGVDDRALLKSLAQGMSTDDGVATFNVKTGQADDMLGDAGYRIIPALAYCVVDRRPIPDELKTFQPTLYYPSTLQLLALSYLAENPEVCP